jgi:hypothetical protein
MKDVIPSFTSSSDSVIHTLLLTYYCYNDNQSLKNWRGVGVENINLCFINVPPVAPASKRLAQPSGNNWKTKRNSRWDGR